MAGINKVILVGNLGKDPEVRTLESGTKVAQFSLATNESYKDKEGNWQERTEWHNIVMWRYLAEKAENNLKKGMQIYLEGKIRTRQWTDQNNQTRYTTDIIAEKFIMLGSRGDNPNLPPLPTEDDYAKPQTASAGTTEKPAAQTPEPSPETTTDDDLPF
jgi:single-strand DNA-binding protein